MKVTTAMDQQPLAPTTVPTTPAAAPQVQLPNVPPTWPGAFGVYKYSKQAVKSNLGTILALTLISLVLGGAASIKSIGQGGTSVLELISLFMSMALYFTYLASVRGERVSLGQAFAQCKPLLYLKLLVNLIFIGVAGAFALLLLIVPFFIILPRIIFAPYLVIDRKLGPLTAINESWAMTKGHAGKIWGIIGATIAMIALAVTIIGIPFAIYFTFMYGAATFVLYEFIAKGYATQPAEPAYPVVGAAPVAAPTAVPAAYTPAPMPTAAVAPEQQASAPLPPQQPPTV